jgi:hypothetical protein
MDLFHISYQITGSSSQRELLLNVRAKRWSERNVIRTVIKNEFPAAVLPPMKFKQWEAEKILESFGISNYQIRYLDLPTFQGVTEKSGIVSR